MKVKTFLRYLLLRKLSKTDFTDADWTMIYGSSRVSRLLTRVQYFVTAERKINTGQRPVFLFRSLSMRKDTKYAKFAFVKEGVAKIIGELLIPHNFDLLGR